MVLLRTSGQFLELLPVRQVLLRASISFALLGCAPGWAIVVTNDTNEPHYVSYVDAGQRLVFEVPARSAGLLGIGNAPGPASVDLLDRSCAFVDSVRVERDGGTQVTLSLDGFEAETTALPQEIPEPQLEPTEFCK